MLTLYDYFRSSAAFRVRIALNYKGLEFKKITVNLLKDEQNKAEYLEQNPSGLVPLLVTENGEKIHQSLAIIEYLEATFPTNSLLPKNPSDLAYVRSIAYDIAMDIHPLNNRRILNYLLHDLSIDEEKKNQWYLHWINKGLTALEELLQKTNRHGTYCFGDEFSMADACLVPQIYNARRFKCNLDHYPILLMIDNNCQNLDAVKKSLPQE